MSVFEAKSYFKFWLKSQNQHGIHSPFVFKFVSECIYDTSKYEEYTELNSFIKKLINSDTEINVDDYGAGSHKLKQNKRKVSDMAKIAGSNFDESKLFFRISKYFKPQNILELGTSLGIATKSFATGYKSNIVSIEGSKEIYEYNKLNFKKSDIEFKNCLFDDYLQNLKKDKTFDLIFIDGNHTYDATIKYFNILKKHIHNDSVIIFDDIYWSEEMNKAWKEIMLDTDVTLSIDGFSLGFVFFRKEQQHKEHFNVRINSRIGRMKFII